MIQKAGSTTLHVAVHGMPVRVMITEGTTADCTLAGALTDGITAEYLLAARGYDTDGIVRRAKERGIKVVIAPKRNREVQRTYDRALLFR